MSRKYITTLDIDLMYLFNIPARELKGAMSRGKSCLYHSLH